MRAPRRPSTVDTMWFARVLGRRRPQRPESAGHRLAPSRCAEGRVSRSTPLSQRGNGEARDSVTLGGRHAKASRRGGEGCGWLSGRFHASIIARRDWETASGFVYIILSEWVTAMPSFASQVPLRSKPKLTVSGSRLTRLLARKRKSGAMARVADVWKPSAGRARRNDRRLR
jgi:hypothetical protein